MDQYTSVSGQAQSYDLNGNLTSDGTRSFVFSSQNQLLSATTSAGASTYAYGPANRRVRKETPDGTVTDFVMTGEMVIAEYDGNGQLLRRYIPGAGVDQRIMVVHCNGSATGRPPAPATHSQYYLPDRQGHVLATISETGGVVQKFHYTPFGVEMVGDPTGNPFRYTGRYYDAETGLYYYRARYYDADLGRFLSVDPIGYADQWNLYAYVGNSPLMYTDPSGMVGDPVGYGIKFEADLFFVVGVGYDIGVAYDPTTRQLNADFKLRAGAGIFINGGLSPVINPGNGVASPSFNASGRMYGEADLSAQFAGAELSFISAEAEKRRGEEWRHSTSGFSLNGPWEDDPNDHRIVFGGARAGGSGGGEIDFDWSFGGSGSQQLGDISVGQYSFNDVRIDGSTISGSFDVAGSRISRKFEVEIEED